MSVCTLFPDWLYDDFLSAFSVGHTLHSRLITVAVSASWAEIKTQFPAYVAHDW